MILSVLVHTPAESVPAPEHGGCAQPQIYVLDPYASLCKDTCDREADFASKLWVSCMWLMLSTPAC